MKVNLRGKFIIDPDGVLQAVEVLNEPVGRNIDELVRQVQALQEAVGSDKATPAGWEPGDKTLKPGPDLVNKVHEQWEASDGVKDG